MFLPGLGKRPVFGFPGGEFENPGFGRGSGSRSVFCELNFMFNTFLKFLHFRVVPGCAGFSG